MVDDNSSIELVEEKKSSSAEANSSANDKFEQVTEQVREKLAISIRGLNKVFDKPGKFGKLCFCCARSSQQINALDANFIAWG